MTPASEALYRRVAAALEAQGHPSAEGLLDKCPCPLKSGDIGWAEATRCFPCWTASHNPKRFPGEPFHDIDCLTCHGTGTVVPSEAECGWRLGMAAENYEQTRDGESWNLWLLTKDKHIRGYGRGKSPLDALLRAVAASLGIEAQEAPDANT